MRFYGCCRWRCLRSHVGEDERRAFTYRLEVAIVRGHLPAINALDVAAVQRRDRFEAYRARFVLAEAALMKQSERNKGVVCATAQRGIGREQRVDV